MDPSDIGKMLPKVVAVEDMVLHLQLPLPNLACRPAVLQSPRQLIEREGLLGPEVHRFVDLWHLAVLVPLSIDMYDPARVMDLTEACFECSPCSSKPW